jgi:hypothetical protein
MGPLGFTVCLLIGRTASGDEPDALRSELTAHVTPEPTSDEDASRERPDERSFHHEIGFRARNLSLPASILS